MVLLAPAIAAAQPLTVEGRSYDDSIVVAGKTLHRLGAGVREKWLFNVYVMAAYSESSRCDAAAIINADEVKYLRIDVLRDVPADRMAAAIGGAIGEHMPRDASAELTGQRRAFESYFKDRCANGTTIEFTYVPGSGTSVTQAGRPLGPPLAGRAFMTVLWDAYFGANSCCAALKTQILKGCR